jgi:thymidylate synthase
VKESEVTDRRPGNIPVLCVRAGTLPEAWEKAVLAVWDQGVSVRTEYDRKDAAGRFLDPPSKDCTMVIEVDDPFAEPRIHKNFPGGPEELEVYRQEVVAGIHDHWVDPSDPDKWTYTYHQRLVAYRAVENLEDPATAHLSVVDQLAEVVEKAARTPHSRRLQAITWIPNADPKTEDPPCLQRLWFRLLADGQEGFLLNMNAHWRSRDAYKAWFMNAYALTDLGRVMADGVAKKVGRPVRLGRYVDISDSFHVYGSYFAEVEPEVAKMKAEPDYRTRAWRSDHPVLVAMTEETRAKLRRDPDYMHARSR